MIPQRIFLLVMQCHDQECGVRGEPALVLTSDCNVRRLAQQCIHGVCHSFREHSVRASIISAPAPHLRHALLSPTCCSRSRC